MKVGELTGFLSYVLQILNSLMMISNVFLLLTRSMASGARILEVIDEKGGSDGRKKSGTSKWNAAAWTLNMCGSSMKKEDEGSTRFRTFPSI